VLPVHENAHEAACSDEAGYTVLEAIVALTILVLVATAFQSGLRTGSAAIRASDLESAAMAVAKSELEKVGVAAPLEEGQREGRTPDGFDWVVSQRPRQQGQQNIRVIPYWIVVTVTWHDHTNAQTRSLSLTGLKLKRGS
jgi:type II secretory pathway pseudopilin PulG